MAYNRQSPYDTVPGHVFRPQQRTYEAQQQYATKYNNYGAGDQGFRFDERPVYEPSPSFVGEDYGQHDLNLNEYGTSMQHGESKRIEERGYNGVLWDHGNSDRNVEQGRRGDMALYGNMRRTPPQQRPLKSERRTYDDPRGHEPSQPYHLNPAASFGPSQANRYNQHDQYGRRREPERPLMIQNDLPAAHSPRLNEGQAHDPAASQGEGTFHNQTQYHPPLPQPYIDSQILNSGNQGGRYTADSPPTVNGSNNHITNTMIANATYPKANYSQPPVDVHASQQALFQKPPPRRILTNPSSPDTISWDNPFPTFGTKKKAPPQNRGNLDDSIARMSLNDAPHQVGNAAQKPQIGIATSSQNSLSKSGHHESSILNQKKPAGTQYAQELEASLPGGRRSEDTRVGTSFPPNMSFNSQRSRTMPSNISEVAHNFSPFQRHDDQSPWQEPAPTAKYDVPETIVARSDAVPQEDQHDQTNSSSSKLDLTAQKALPIKGNPSHPQHSAHNSLGDFYDSYYHESQPETQIYAQDEFYRQPHSPDDVMPNFDAVPQTGHRRGMTIDFHLEPQQQFTFGGPPSSNNIRHEKALPPQPHSHTAGQLNKSKSQPNLKDQTPRGYLPDNGFVFDLPGDTAPPPIPPISPLRTNFGLRNIANGGPQPENLQIKDNEAMHLAKQPIAPDNRSDGGTLLNQTYHGVFQEGTQPQRYRSPPLQASNVHHAQPERPGSKSSQINLVRSNPHSVTPPNPDALPPHPTPIRPGLIQGASLQQTANPPHFRQYNSEPNSSGSTKMAKVSVSISFEELERFRQAAKSNPSDQKAQFLLAKKLVEASTVLIDDGGRADQKTRIKNREKYIFEAHRIIKKLVNNRFTEATFYLADCYSRGSLGLEIDTKEAFNLYQTAAKSGHAQAAYRVAVCCEMGQEEGGGTRRDPSKAMQWYQRAAALGDTPAMYKIGIIQLKGLLGQPKNSQEALKWLKRAADKANEENPHALHELGLLYEGTLPNAPVAKDEAYSKQLFTQAANLGYKFSQFRLGCAYEYGSMGCPIDPRQSIAWYSKAAVQDEHQSELALSGWYLTGSEGVLQQSDTEAYLWARKAAQAGLAKAEYAMGYFTEVGIGVPAHLEDAKRWYWRAASQNFPKARDRLEALRKGGAKMEKSRVSRSAIRKQTDGDCRIM